MPKICCTYDTQAAQVYNAKNSAQRKHPKKLQAHMMSKKSLRFPKMLYSLINDGHKILHTSVMPKNEL